MSLVFILSQRLVGLLPGFTQKKILGQDSEQSGLCQVPLLDQSVRLGMEIKRMATPIGARDWLVLERSLGELGVSL